MRSFRKYVHVVNILCKQENQAYRKILLFVLRLIKRICAFYSATLLSWKDGFVCISNEIFDILYCDDSTLILTGER